MLVITFVAKTNDNTHALASSDILYHLNYINFKLIYTTNIKLFEFQEINTFSV